MCVVPASLASCCNRPAKVANLRKTVRNKLRQELRGGKLIECAHLGIYASALHANRLGSVGTFGREDLVISDEQLRKAVFSSLLCAIPVGFSQSEGQSNVLEYLCSAPGFRAAFGSSQPAPAALLLLLFGRASTEIPRGVFTCGWEGKFLALSHGYGQRIQGVPSCALRRAENADHQVTVVWKFQFGTPFTTAIRRLRRR